jgi:hypothetical protein
MIARGHTMLRIAIVVLAVLELISFFWFGYMGLQWEILLHPLTVHQNSFGSALVTAVIAPLLALGAIALVTAARRPGIAIALLCAAFVVFYGEMIPFVIGVMIYGA